MKISQIILETSTTAGVVATVAKPLGEVQQRTPVNGLEPISKIMKGTAKKKGPYANSLSEGAMNQLSMDLKDGVDGLSDEEFQKKYKISKQEARKELTANRKENKKPEKVNEADLQEDDIIVVPGQGRLKKTGFVKHDPDKAEHEGQTLKNSLHTIIRLATHLNKELSVRDNFPEWVSEKVGSIKGDMLAVMNYIISTQEMSRDGDAMEGFGGSKFGAGVIAGGPQYEGAKTDRMVKHVAQSEKKLGHDKKEAENIAWATANKRGMLNNKNKKAK